MPSSDRPLTDTQERALAVLADAEHELHPSRVARLAGDRRPNANAGAAYRNALFALKRRGLARATYMRTHGRAALFVITEAGRAMLASMGD